MLRKMCLKYKRLPPSHTVADELRWIGGYPWGGGGNADVWRGVYRGSSVAIKVLRVNSKDFDSLEKVRSFIFIPSNENMMYADENGAEILLRSGPVEAIPTPKRAAAGGGEKNAVNHVDGFRVDGTWDNHGLRHRMSCDQSTQTGE